MTVVLPTPTQLRAVAEQCGLSLTDEDVASFRGLMQGSVEAYNLVTLRRPTMCASARSACCSLSTWAADR